MSKKPVLRKLPKYPTEAMMWRRIKNDLDVDYDRAYRIEAINTPGFPDVIWVPYKKYPVLIELKAGPLKFRPQQIKMIRDLHALETIIWVIWQKEIRGPTGVFKGISLLSDPANAVGQTLENWAAFMRSNTWAKP